ncbi:MAG: hypothetical protein RQ839_05485 [Thermoproteus sp.]|nr:hypothetical protein [Thermoproteus sp.]MDT7881474.1 hypothetical protein [Thermoproteus sp.]
MGVHIPRGSVRLQGAAAEASYVEERAAELLRRLVPDEGRMPEEPRRWGCA